jgi:ABC-type antimicrobial peptide transport system permease subunit
MNKKVMTYQYSSELIGESSKSKNENNDCFVRAISTATGSSYDSAHAFVKERFQREDKKGTFVELNLEPNLKSHTIDGITFELSKVDKSKVVNTYKLYGELIDRQKTVKSFIKDNQKGTYIVLVSKHAFTVKDGVLIDNKGMEFKPTRKVQGAIKVTVDSPVDTQLSLF